MPDGQIQYQPRKGVDARFRDTFIEVKVGIDAMRTLRGSLFRLAEIVAAEPGTSGILLLTDSVVTEQRLLAEWEISTRVIREELWKRLSICLITHDGEFRGVPRPPKSEMQNVLREVAKHESSHLIEHGVRNDFAFVVQKVLLHNLFASARAMTVGEIAMKAGCSFPTAAQVVRNLGSLIERTSDRRVRLKYFPRDRFDRLAARSESARATIRFADMSGQPRSPESLVKKLEKLRPPNVAIGGVLGARHYLESLDLVGTTRLDLSVHAPRGTLNLDFVSDLDPALRRVSDPQTPALVAIHAVRQNDSLFTERQKGLFWADEVECLLDLQEGGLQAQTGEFFDWLARRAKGHSRG